MFRLATLSLLLLLCLGKAGANPIYSSIPKLPADELLQQLQINLARFRSLRPQEKTYLRLDKPYYTAGDTIWFKAWQVQANSLQANAPSKVLYAEILAPDGQLVLSRKVRISNGSGAGDFVLPDTLSSGKYQVRAYTNWMRNFDKKFWFSQAISIINPTQPKVALRQPLGRADGPGLQFFPESGNLVTGLTSQVAVKATDASGLPLKVKGNILDASGAIIVSFETNINGIGAFALTPARGQVYTATITGEPGLGLKEILPVASATGVSLAVTSTPAAYTITVKTATNSAVENSPLLIAQAHDSIYYAARLNMNEQEATISVPQHTFPTGLVQWVLFRDNGQVLAERLVFVRGPELQVKIKTDKATYAPREKVNLIVAVTNDQGQPVQTSLALAVTDAKQLTDPEALTRDIRSQLLLTADLTEPVANPAFYFSQNRAEADKALDNLLLTQTWGRFSWGQLTQGELPAIPFDSEEGISLQGRLTDAAGKPLVRNIVMASVLTAERAFRKDFTDDDGSFNFGNFDFDNYIEVVFQQYKDGQNAVGKILLDSARAETLLNPTVVRSLLLPPALTHYIDKSKMRVQINEAYGMGTPDTTNQINLTEAIGSPTAKRNIFNDYVPDVTIRVADYINFPTVAELIKELVPGVAVAQRKGKYRFRVLNFQRKIYFKGEPLYIIDKVPVYDQQLVLNLDPANIESVEVIALPVKLAAFGQLGFHGVLVINTKNNDFYPYDLRDVTRLRVSGYNPPRPFYLPDYSPGKSQPLHPDLRPLLYWQHDVQTDANGQATVSFYNSDDESTFRVLAEGLSKEGIPGVGYQEYQIRAMKR